MFTHTITINNGVTTYGEWATEADFRDSQPPLRTWTEGEPLTPEIPPQPADLGPWKLEWVPANS
jgi:hypothetical protein